ncbi:hypothetical protein PHMEG_0006434 [Phytophthora megakarya]|uniref:Uncharacterized protein n=1 Tax=Phytophthora megakarya TaxID=4795 RepID=A0A225WQY4_9STRA|nr:hypothetical protein PHMEG_0006434 [Phytophthora megakarya]
MRDTNKRPRVASTGEVKTHKKKTEGEEKSQVPDAEERDITAEIAAIAVKNEQLQSSVETLKRKFSLRGEETHQLNAEERDITAEIAAIAEKNEQLQSSVDTLKRKFSLRGEETHQLLLGLGALNAVANELAALQKDYQERSTKNVALIQESLTQISNCSAQVDTLKRCRGLTASQLQTFRHECTQQMNTLVNRLADLAVSTCEDTGAGEEVLCTAVQVNNNRLQVERLKEEVCEYRARFAQKNATVESTQQETTNRINLALTQLDELHSEMFQLKQTLVQENQSFRRHLENLVSRQMAHIREVQDNESERIYEEMDEIRSGMCGILKDMHRLKERTKYMVPSMARAPRISRSNPNGSPPQQSGYQKDERWMNIPTANSQSTGYSMAMASGQCQDQFPHYEHGFNDDYYCPGVSNQMEHRFTHLDQPRSPRSSNSSAGRSDDENWRMLTPEDAPASGQRDDVQPFESPHYSSRSSSLSGRLSVGTRSLSPSACVQTIGRPVCPEQLAQGRAVKWRGINIVHCRLRRRACGTER